MIRELEECKSVVDATFKEMQRARQYLKERSLVRFRDPFGSPERDTANYLFEEAERDFREKLAAFQWATKSFDDVKMRARAMSQ